jgi:hypothetical protein
MGTGIDLARLLAPEHAALIENMKDQLLIVFLKRLGGSADISVAEVDATGQDLFAFSLDVDKRSFHFEIRKKS